MEPISSSSADHHTHASRIQRVGLHQYLFEHTNTLLVDNLSIILNIQLRFVLVFASVTRSPTVTYIKFQCSLATNCPTTISRDSDMASIDRQLVNRNSSIEFLFNPMKLIDLFL